MSLPKGLQANRPARADRAFVTLVTNADYALGARALVRSIVLSVREEPYVEGAISVGTPSWTLMIRHILPNTVAPLIVQATFVAAAAIIIEAILSFLGIGIPPEIPSWGNIMAEGWQYMIEAPWIIAIPGAALMITVLGLNLLGDGLRDVLDPRLRIQQ